MWIILSLTDTLEQINFISKVANTVHNWIPLGKLLLGFCFPELKKINYQNNPLMLKTTSFTLKVPGLCVFWEVTLLSLTEAGGPLQTAPESALLAPMAAGSLSQPSGPAAGQLLLPADTSVNTAAPNSSGHLQTTIAMIVPHLFICTIMYLIFSKLTSFYLMDLFNIETSYHWCILLVLLFSNIP